MPDSPVDPILTDAPGKVAEPGTALCLSGGGYRAMVFHTGVLALAWKKSSFDPAKTRDDFVPHPASGV